MPVANERRSMTDVASSVRAGSDGGIVSLSALAAEWLMFDLLRRGSAGSGKGALTLASGAAVVKGRWVTVRRGRSLRQRKQHVDRVAQVEALSEPVGACRARGEAQALRGVIGTENFDGVFWYRNRRRHVRQQAAVRPQEAEGAVGPARDLIPLLVDRAMVPTTEEGDVRERGRAPVRPVAQVMPLCDADPAAREAAAPVPMLERAPQRGRNGPGPGPDFQESPIVVMAHHHPAGVARQAARRFRPRRSPRPSRAPADTGFPARQPAPA